MGKRKAQKNIIKIVAMTSMTIFSLMAVFTGTLAWFNANRVINNGGDNFAVKSLNGLLESLSVHELSSFSKNGSGDITAFNFNSAASSTVTMDSNYNPVYDGSTASLNTYSILDQSNPVLLLFHLNEATPANKVKINAIANNGVAYTASQFQSDISATGNPLSWIIKYSSISFASTVNYSITPSSLENEGSFMVLDANQETFSSFAPTQAFFNTVAETRILHVGIVLNYYPEALNYIYTVNLGKDFLSTFESNVGFDCDWVMEI